MVISMKVSGLMTKQMVMANTLILKALFMRANGSKIFRAAMAKKVGQMAVDTVVSIKMAKNMERVLTGGQMVQFMKEIG